MTPLTEEEKKKKGESPASVSPGGIVSPQASMEAPAKPSDAIMSGVSVGGSRPAIYNGQPATGNIYAQADPVQTPKAPVVDMSAGPTTTDSVGNAYTPETGFNPGRAIVNMLKNSAEAARTGVAYQDVVQKNAVATTHPAAPAAVPAAAPAIVAPPVASYSNEGRAFSQPNVNPVSVSGITSGMTVGADGRPQKMFSGKDISGAPDGMNTTNLSAANASAAKANQIRQEMIDAQAMPDQTKGPSGGIIEDKNKTDREALFAKWDRENMVKQVANMNPRNAAAVAALLGSGDRAASELAQNNTARRGQDFTRESQAANAAVANREVANRERGTTSTASLQEAQSKGILAGVENQTKINELQQKAATGDKAALEALRAIKGKGGDANFKGLHAAGGSSIDPSTGQVVKSPDNVVIYNEQTGQIQQLGAGGQGAAGKAPVVGEVRGGYKFKGGNPADKAAWEKV